ncbi:hypothetical protein DID96_32875 [Burkholderia sp. Bp8963]|uniref:hypothetical protein n=1 Tax=Burkholderia sp. Bp8963 TaxID=2184547 RepID=UPI000F5AFA31|nr:hypothetical protein [Burkholderia sp. Bp8963]RQS61543.1 hypothetical protein DID96_32875 [Burkholderia sp. Bp8963]
MKFSIMLRVAAMVAVTASASAHAQTSRLQCFDEKGRPIASSPHCFELELPKDAQLQWSAWLSPVGTTADARIAVSGIVDDNRFVPTAIGPTSPDDPAKPDMLMFNTPLLPDLTIRPFGQEERASASRNRDGDAIAIACRPGRQPAGIVLARRDARWPRVAAGDVVLAGNGSAGFQWGMAAAGRDPGALYPLQRTVGTEAVHGRIDLATLPAGTENLDQNLVLVCPSEGGRLDLSDVHLAPRAAAAEGGRAAWVWQRSRWEDGGRDLLADAVRYKVSRLYVALPIADGQVTGADALRDFVARAHGAGIQVWAVEGDPDMVTEKGREQAVARLRAIGQYQRASTEPTRLGGVQYDIEPYQLPAYRTEPQAVMHAWGTTVAALGDAAALPLDTVLPFWLLDAPGGNEVLDRIGRAAQSLTVMAYRTDAAHVQRVAAPLLAWGATRNFPVSVALENGPMQDEWTQTYAPVPRGGAGTLWLVPEDGKMVAVRLDRATTLARGIGYVEKSRERIDADKVSFLGDPDRLLTVSASLQPVFRAWPNYAGIAFHGLLDR